MTAPTGLLHDRELELFHINRKLAWGGEIFSPGHEYVAGGEFNPFFKRFMHNEPKHEMSRNGESAQDFFSRLNNGAKSGNVQVPRDIFRYAEASIRHYKMLSRELLFEATRMSVNRNLPSRQRCLFMTDEDNIGLWKKSLEGKAETRIARCRVKGNIALLDANYIDKNFNLGLNAWLDSSIRYWSGQATENPAWEYLVQGSVEVLEIL